MRKFVSGINYNAIAVIDCLHENESQTGIQACDLFLDLTPGGTTKIVRYMPKSEAELWEVFDALEAECPRIKPILHIEGHGSKKGLELRRGNQAPFLTVPWSKLLERCRRLNIASHYNLGMFVAACDGIEALRPLTIKKAAPYMYVVGPSREVNVGKIAEGTRAFYEQILCPSPDLNRAFRALPPEFTAFLAERFFAMTYTQVLRASLGKARLRRVDYLVGMVLPQGAEPQTLRSVRDQAKSFSRPDRERFELIQRQFLPGGVSFDFEDLLHFARTGAPPVE